MKKNLFLTLMLALLCTATAWAKFSPVQAKKYALREKTTGLFLDIQTLGINEPYAGVATNNISLSTKPCIVYFEPGDNGKYKIKNVDAAYVAVGDRAWNAVIAAAPYEWIVSADENGIDNLTISKDGNNYIGWDEEKPITAVSPLYNNAEGDNAGAQRMYFSLVEYSLLGNELMYTLQSPTGISVPL